MNFCITDTKIDAKGDRKAPAKKPTTDNNNSEDPDVDPRIIGLEKQLRIERSVRDGAENMIKLKPGKVCYKSINILNIFELYIHIVFILLADNSFEKTPSSMLSENKNLVEFFEV